MSRRTPAMDRMTPVVSAGERLHRFHGGLRLRHNKQISCRLPLAPLPVPEELVVPLLQHRGPPAEPRVNKGQQVLKGDLLGMASGPGASVHAPTSGRVVAIEHRPMAHATGQPGPCVVLHADGEDRRGERRPLPGWRDAAPETVWAHLRAAGVVGLGGAVFPTDRKLASARAPIHTLILNGAECEPYIACDEILMRERPDRIVAGALILRHALGAERVVIAIEEGMDAAEARLRDASRDLAGGEVEVIPVPAMYPEGGERQLVQTLTGQEVPDGSYPPALGLLVQNVATAAAVRDAVLAGEPLIERVVTVTGNGVHEPRNVLARVGTPVANLVQAAGGYREGAVRLVIGGPMMGYPLASDGEPVVKATNCLLILDRDDVRPTQAEMPCIRCGDCAAVCPSRLLPQELLFQARARQWDTVSELGMSACIECGCCDAVCPSHIPLTQWFRFAKGAVRDQAREREAAARARERFEARERRRQRQQRERAERLARRKKQLADQDSRKRQIAAALERAKKRTPPSPDDR